MSELPSDTAGPALARRLNWTLAVVVGLNALLIPLLISRGAFWVWVPAASLLLGAALSWDARNGSRGGWTPPWLGGAAALPISFAYQPSAASTSDQAIPDVQQKAPVPDQSGQVLPTARLTLMRIGGCALGLLTASALSLSLFSPPAPDYYGVCSRDGIRVPDSECILAPPGPDAPAWVYYPAGTSIPLAGYAAAGSLPVPPSGASFVNGHVPDGVDRTPSPCSGPFTWRC